ncbi:MAG: HEAT repeat domain-containing protein [Verrucomicrobiales bacterium]|nr:HEAT repeat domain-containing protein [Verrucomicrobiales bacterium]
MAALSATAVLLGVWLARRENPHLEALLSQDLGVMCEDDDVRRGELEAAGDQAVPFLRSVLRREPGPVDRVASALNSAGVTSWLRDWVSASLADALDRHNFERDRSKRMALNSLLLMGPRAEAARPELVALMAYPPLGVEALAVLAATDPNNPTVTSNYLVRLSASQGERFELAWYFPKVWTSPPPFLTHLTARLMDPDDDVRARAAFSLAGYGAAASNAIPQLEELMSAPVARVRPNAAYALAMVSPRHAEVAVQAMLGQQRTNRSWTGAITYMLYATLGPAAREAVPLLRAELETARINGFAGPPAFALWRITGEASPEVIAGLIRGVTQPIQRYQLMSLEGLKEIGPPASNAVPVLRPLLKARHRALQRAAEDALRSVSGAPRL